jgi:hypothetical protein
MLACVFASLAAYAAYKDADVCWVYGLLFSCVGMCGLAFFAPQRLAHFSNAWMKMGDLMGKVVSPLVLGAIFFLLITPTALLGWLFGRDELRLKKTNISSYWVDRVPPGPDGESFKDQF